MFRKHYYTVILYVLYYMLYYMYQITLLTTLFRSINTYWYVLRQPFLDCSKPEMDHGISLLASSPKLQDASLALRALQEHKDMSVVFAWCKLELEQYWSAPQLPLFSTDPSYFSLTNSAKSPNTVNYDCVAL